MDIAVIAVWLGHESIETTNVYVHANLAMKEKALAKIQPMDIRSAGFAPTTACSRSLRRSDLANREAQNNAPRRSFSATDR